MKRARSFPQKLSENGIGKFHYDYYDYYYGLLVLFMVLTVLGPDGIPNDPKALVFR